MTNPKNIIKKILGDRQSRNNEEIVEEGICKKCGEYYEKNIRDSNLSMTGFCTQCGWNA